MQSKNQQNQDKRLNRELRRQNELKEEIKALEKMYLVTDLEVKNVTEMVDDHNQRLSLYKDII